MVPGVGVEPTRCIAPKDFKSFASTSSATRAFPYFQLLMYFLDHCFILFVVHLVGTSLLEAFGLSAAILSTAFSSDSGVGCT